MPVQFAQEKTHQGEYEKKYLHTHLAKNYKGWVYLPHLMLEHFPRKNEVRLVESSGIIFSFYLRDSEAALLSDHGISNTSGERPSGQYDVRNTRIIYHQDKILVYSCDGIVRHYTQPRALGERVVYFLEKEILPNGKILRYHIDSPARIRIESQDPQERHAYATLTVDSRGSQDVHFTTSSGGHAIYHYTQNLVDWRIKKGKSVKKARAKLPLLLSSVDSPFFASESLSYCRRYLLASYIGKEQQCGLHHDGFGNPRHYRVDKLALPVSAHDAFLDIYSLDYDPAIAGQKGGKTTVKHLDGTSTVYHFSKNLLTACVQSFDQGQLKQEKRLNWTENNWLNSVEMVDGEGRLFYRKTFEYDRFGNPRCEYFTGDLTGYGQEQTLTTRRQFTNDGSSLLLEEEEEGGKTTCTAFLAGTHLLSSKLIKVNGRIVQRTFHRYDDAYNLIETIHDDGSSEVREECLDVTQRKITRYLLKQEHPYLHMPEWIVMSYKQDGEEKLLEKRHLIYNNAGYVAEEAVYGADGQHAYTLCKTYNERGDILTETNALGDQATYIYDARGRRLTETSFSGRLKKEVNYDLRGRKLSLQENDHRSCFTYDVYDRCLSKTDLFGHTTVYEYDPLSGQATQASLAERVTRANYDPFGRKLTQHDANGNATQYYYNAYGSPVEIIYADGGKETFRYTKQGWLQSHTTLDGTTTHYERDPFGRVLKKVYGESAEERFTYNAFNLLSETDKEGNTKFYFYDGAGRKIREEFCGHITQFNYDALGKLATVKADGLSTHYARDRAGRLCEETKTDSLGNLLYKIGYAYDKDGNRTAIKRFIQGDEAVQTFSFDPFGRCIEEQDALGAKVTTHHDEEHVNTSGQRVLRVVTTDPLSIVKIDTYDIFSPLVKTEKFDSAGKPLAAQENSYDAQGNRLCEQEHIYQDGQYQHTQSVNYAYTPTQQIQSCTQGVQRTTHYTYLPSGKMLSKTLPDGTILLYAYDALGFLSRIDSSDGAIHHAFRHNRLGYLTSAYDEKQNLLIERQVDPFGNVLSEVFPSGLHIEKTYDAHNRLTSLILPNGTVEYTYDPLYLRRVSRTTEKGERYAHIFASYDLGGNLFKETLPGDLGDVAHVTNGNGYPVGHNSPYFSQYCHYDASNNITHIIADKSCWQYTYDGLSQLTSENDAFIYRYDSHFNRTHKNGVAFPMNTLNELQAHTYDLNGCQTTLNGFTLTYDPLQRLIAAHSKDKEIHFTYDPLGRRLSKTMVSGGLSKTEHYLYHGRQEIGAFRADHSCKNLRICTGNRTLAIELPGRTLIPLHDVQNNIRRLIDLKSHALANAYDFSAFGEELQPAAPIDNPWRFASKRFDPDLRLIDFGARFYNPHAGRWLTPDPAGFHDSTNLYQYVFNNPFKYTDPNGQFVIPALALAWKLVVALCVAMHVGYQVGQMQDHSHSSSAINDFNAAVHQFVQSSTGIAGYLLTRNLINKNIDVYAPDRPLPRDEKTNEPIPEADTPHTELGTKQGSKGPYPQAREFDKDGKPVKDIDFTDHGRPHRHPLPHQHQWKPNETGGTPKRSRDAQPLPNWNYE